MSTTKSVQLTKEEEEYLKLLEEEFKDRYTENDEEFQAVFKAKLPHPPVVENWRDFRRSNFRYNRNSYYGEDNRYSNSSKCDSTSLSMNDGYSHSSRDNYKYRERTHTSFYRPY